jgi:hypothetical protein
MLSPPRREHGVRLESKCSAIAKCLPAAAAESMSPGVQAHFLLPPCRVTFHSTRRGKQIMPRGSKEKYTDKQKRQAEHIEEGYKEQGVSEDEAESRAWATVNKISGGGKKSGSGRGKKINKRPMKKGGR